MHLLRQTDSTTWGVEEKAGGGVWTVSQLVNKSGQYLCVDIRRRRVVLLFCLFVGVDVCLGKVPPCVAVNQYIFYLPIGPDSSSETEPHPVEREKKRVI